MRFQSRCDREENEDVMKGRSKVSNKHVPSGV